MAEDTLLHRFLAAADAGEFERFPEFLHADVIVHAPLGLSTNSVEAEQAVWREALEAMPDIEHRLVDVVATETFIAGRAVVSGTMRSEFAGVDAAGKSFVVDQAWFMRVRDGKAEEVWEIIDSTALLQQLGVAGERAS
jgi:steroid delta-isomerase-like uncharacterized protein